MWQRIQTLYLIIIALLMGLFAFSDIFILSSTDGKAVILDAWTLRDLSTQTSQAGVWGMGVLAILAGVLAVSVIFIYRNRVLQARLSTLNALLLVGLIGLMGYAGYTTSAGLSLGFKFAIAYPLVAVILQVMAIRAIWLDEALVRTSQRLRD